MFWSRAVKMKPKHLTDQHRQNKYNREAIEYQLDKEKR